MDGKLNNADGFEILDTTPEDIAHDIVNDLVENMPTTSQLDGMAEEQQEGDQQVVEVKDDNAELDAKILKTTSPEAELVEAASTSTPVTTTLEKGASTESSKSNTSSELDNIYQVKWIGWRSNRVPIITQNSNGPCPMLAIANILLLRGKMELQDGCEMVSSEQLIERLGGLMFDLAPKNLDPSQRLDYEANVGEAVDLLPKLQTGLDVNVKFSSVSDFEYTKECIVFDLFNIALYHGWLVDPQQEEVVKAVDGLSYNQLVERIINNKTSSDSDLINQSLVAQNFLEESASQLTYHGLCELVSTMKDNELAIFFRNNHFSTLHKHKNEIFLLVTDQGFLKEPSVVWETLNSTDGDCHFVDSDFLTAPPKVSPKLPKGPLSQGELLSPEQQLEQDLQIAKALGAQQATDDQWEAFKETTGDTSNLTDEELAKKLQEFEQNAAEQEQPAISDEELARQLQAEENRAQESQRASGAAAAASGGAASAIPSTSRPQGSPGRQQAQGSPPANNNNKKCIIL